MSRPTAEERVDRIQKALEVLNAGKSVSYTVDQAIAVAQVGATLAVAEAMLVSSDVFVEFGRDYSDSQKRRRL